MGCGKTNDRIGEPMPPPNPSTTDTNAEKDSFMLATTGTSKDHRRRPTSNAAMAAAYQTPVTPQLTAEFVYGYSRSRSGNNLFYLKDEDFVVYPCGAISVILNTNSNSQHFLGGGEINTAEGHSRAVLSLAITTDREKVATGEEGLSPFICLWKPGSSLKPEVTIEPGSNSRGISLLSFSAGGKQLAAVDLNPDLTVYVFDCKTGSMVYTSPSVSWSISNISWSPVASVFCTVGDGNVVFWTSRGGDFLKEKCAADADGRFATVVQWFTSGDAVTGDVTGKLHLWKGHKSPAKSYQILPFETTVRALSILHDVVLIGGDDCTIRVLDATFKSIKQIEIPAPPVSLDMYKEQILCGTTEGNVLEFGRNGRLLLMDSHESGKLQAIALDTKASHMLISTGGDIKIKSWDTIQRRCISSGILEIHSDPSDISQGSSALSISASGLIAVGHNDVKS